jgi:hypothetical protein
MPNLRAAFLGLAASIALAAPIHADSDATLQQIYDQARAGHLDQAQHMIDQVLVDHPRSAKAHFVAAELASRAGNLSVARGQLQQAEQIDPGLQFANPQSVRALKAELGARTAGGYEGAIVPRQRGFSWLPGMVLAGLGLLIWAIVRRRSAPAVPYSGAPMGAGPPYPGAYPGPVSGPMGGGLGSGIVGGLASGLALGAGVAAGEEVAHHFLDGNHHHDGVPPVGPDGAGSNDNMGGNDFGIGDGGSWDDGGGGGGDWS